MLPFRDFSDHGSPEMGGHVRGDWIDRLLHEAASMATNSFEGVESEEGLSEHLANRGSSSIEQQPLSLGIGISPQQGPLFSDFETALRQAQNELQEQSPSLPWESGFWGTFFGSQDVLDSMLPGPARLRPAALVSLQDPTQVESGCYRRVCKVCQKPRSHFLERSA